MLIKVEKLELITGGKSKEVEVDSMLFRMTTEFEEFVPGEVKELKVKSKGYEVLGFVKFALCLDEFNPLEKVFFKVNDKYSGSGYLSEFECSSESKGFASFELIGNGPIYFIREELR